MKLDPTAENAGVTPVLMPGGLQFVCPFPYGAKVVGMTQFNGRVYIATEDCVYWLDGVVLRKVEIAAP